MMIRHIFIFIFINCTLFLYSQIPNGTWRDHLPYNQGIKVVEAGTKIFQASSGGMLSFDIDDNSIQKYTKVTGLSDVNITSLAYADEYYTLIIGYSNGNIDFMTSEDIYNISAIKLKSIAGTKSINSIKIVEGFAYLACDFGIVVLNISKKEVKDTYIFGEGGSTIKVNDIDINDNILYAATDDGLFSVDLNSPNLLDYNYWSKVNNTMPSNGIYKNITVSPNLILTQFINESEENSEILEVTTTSWEYWGNNLDSTIYDIIIYDNEILVACESGLYECNINGGIINYTEISSCRQAIYGSENVIWAAAYGEGLVRIEGSDKSNIIVNGPPHKDVGYLTSSNGTIWVGTGSRNDLWNPHNFYSFKNENWRYYPGYSYPEIQEMKAFYKLTVDPGNSNHLFCSTYGYGLAEFLNDEIVAVYNESNSIMEGFPGYDNNLRIAGIDFDSKGNVYFVVDITTQPIYRIKEDNTMERLDLNSSNFNSSLIPYMDLLVTSSNQIWVLTQRSGIIVLYEDSNGSFDEKQFNIKNQEGDLINKAFCLAEDNEGNVWVGTDNGPIKYSNPTDIFELSDVVGDQEILPRDDGTNLGDFLLANEVVQSIAIDGGNRKWYATDHSGVFLIDDRNRPSKQIHHFTEENSPLFSNSVGAVTINDQTGEVFFGTSEGILSFMGQSTEGNSDFEDVYVYPNPVRPNYNGDITITGLIENTNVKITDISGNLVYETISLGGQAVWDGSNFDGRRVHTGIYLVFLTTEDGLKTHMTKLMFIH